MLDKIDEVQENRKYLFEDEEEYLQYNSMC